MMTKTAEKRVSSLALTAGVLAISFLCPLDIESKQGASNEPTKTQPRFEQYPVEVWTGANAPVELISPEARMFRTKLRAAAKLSPDFAGRYRFAICGCGTRCASGAIIDLSTGRVFPPPLGGKGTGAEHWIFCTDWDKQHGAEYHADSRLLIVRCGHEYDEHWNDVHYLVWDQDHFREILHFAGKEF